MQKIKKAITITILALLFLGLASQALALKLDNPLQAKDFKSMVDKVVNFVIILAVAIAPIFILYAGFQYMTSGGDPTKVKKATQIITYVVIGLAILLLSKGLIMVLMSVLGVDKGQLQ